MNLSEAVEVARSMIGVRFPSDGPFAEAIRTLAADAERVTTLMACEECKRGVRPRYAVHGMCLDCAAAGIDRLRAEDARLREACAREGAAICQVLGRALGYPRYADDPANFPGATDADGVCTGPHVAATLATEAAGRIGRLTAERDAAIARQVHYCGDYPGGIDRWSVDSGCVDGEEKAGPFFSEAAAIASVLAWVRWAVDPANNPSGPTEDKEDDDE